MYSFELHFDKDGNVQVDNIKGVTPGNSACLALTNPYEHALGVPVSRMLTDTNPIEHVQIEVQLGENE